MTYGFKKIMYETLHKIGRVIKRVAREEDSVLKDIANQGIFHMPELAFAYSCGKAIMIERESVFGDLSPVWKREEDLGNGGPTDLLFELPSGKCIAIEFKLRARGDSYVRDIEKLLRLDSEKYVIAFCALVDTFSSRVPDDGRVGRVEAFSKAKVVSLLEPKPHFVTKQHWYNTETSCVIGFWGISRI